MTRPNIVRADTLDLQDADSPHAAEHIKYQPNGNHIAPHQAQEYQHIIDERHSEEQILADAFDMPNNHNSHGLNGSEEDAMHRDGDGDEDGDQDADDDLMDRISSSPSIDEEDIDFEFVYALHTFVATVEGQANATKGDTMVLLDDSNSYWWLVRVVKDSSIGYLPAEHIETPTERLARLNKHRNIDLAQTMLGDNPEKSRNPLKMAMRRRNAKTVQFAAPTYFEATGYDYSDDEEQPPNEIFTNPTQVEDPATVNGQPIEVEERGAPEEANVHATRRYSGDQSSILSKSSVDSTHKASFDGGIGDDPQLSPKLVDRSEAAPLKSRKGTPRNTDSFLKDDSIETRKITLTPGLLREGDGAATPGSTDMSKSSIDSQRNPSMESLTKSTSPTETATSTTSSKKEKEKKKEKNKGGMLSGLFKSKKKDRKGSKDEDNERTSFDVARGSSPQQSNSPSPDVGNAAIASQREVPAPGRTAPSPVPVASRSSQVAPAPLQIAPRNIPQKAPAPVAELAGSEAAFEMAGTVPDLSVDTKNATSADKDGALSPVANLLKTAPKAKRSKQRVELDDFDSPSEQPGQNPFGDADEDDNDDEDATLSSGTITDGNDFVHIPLSFNDHDEGARKQDAERNDTTDGTDDEIFADARENTTSPISTRTDPTALQQPSRPAPSQPSARDISTSSPSESGGEVDTPKSGSPIVATKMNWDDGALRAWLDAEEVKDMLTIVHASARANGPIEPVTDDHPLMRGLYTEERGAVDRMMTELDGLLMGWADRKGISLGK